MKYTEEELSRILGEHEAGNLIAGGTENWGVPTLPPHPHFYPKGCANQVAYNEEDSGEALDINPAMGELFDSVYRIGGGVGDDVDALLAALDDDPVPP